MLSLRSIRLALAAYFEPQHRRQLNFPNPTRRIDDTGQWVLFTGHDGMEQKQFRLEISAIRQLSRVSDPLSAFDLCRTAIHEAARQIYASSRQNVYILTGANFL